MEPIHRLEPDIIASCGAPLAHEPELKRTSRRCPSYWYRDRWISQANQYWRVSSPRYKEVAAVTVK